MAALRDLVQQGTARLAKGAHADRARPDAELLLQFVLGKDKAWLMTHGEEALCAEDTVRYQELLERRFPGEPMQYILGETEFYGLNFRVTPDVLIPRPETEHLVEKVLDRAAGFESPRIVDVGSGSGAIAVTLAHRLPHVKLTAIDLSAPALDVARQNAETNGVAERVRFLCGDLLAPVAEERFEIVASNPPYVPGRDRDSLAVEVRDYEPGLALFAGDDGLEAYRRLIPAAFAVLTAGGLLVLECGYEQEEAIGALLADAGFKRIEFFPDLQNIPRVACAQRL